MFQNYFIILELQKSFTTYKWVIMYMMYEKNYSLEYNKIKECEIFIFIDDLKF
jgi:sRNA-binding regulator protein Hfq